MFTGVFFSVGDPRYDLGHSLMNNMSQLIIMCARKCVTVVVRRSAGVRRKQRDFKDIPWGFWFGLQGPYPRTTGRCMKPSDVERMRECRWRCFRGYSTGRISRRLR